ncbi:MAG TPA: class I SAM-dependent methyltransferase [Acidimicrobiales bacterium]|jgi:SAM-dependent methyltransferase
MDGYDVSSYGERIAEIYDDLHEARLDVDATVACLADLAAGGPALELAIGTGRVALPLAATGVTVAGIDISPAMVAKLRAKAGGNDIEVMIGDFADVAVGDTAYRLVYLVFNTLFALLTQKRQVQCFENVARHLTDDGVFVVEAFVPDLGRFRHHQNVTAAEVGLAGARLDVSRHDPARQRIDSSHLVFSDGSVRLYPIAIRYAWPSELDLMAQLAGLRLLDRWSGWRREPFGPDSGGHVSVYGR